MGRVRRRWQTSPRDSQRAAVRAPRSVIPLTATLLLALLAILLLLGPQGVAAHGKDILVEVATLSPDADQPLRRLYRIQLLYADDREPVERARGTLSASREDGVAIRPLPLAPLGSPGTYGVEVVYPRFGSWSVSLQVVEPGQAEFRLEDEVLPRRGSSQRDTGADSARLEVLRGYFRFDPGDVLNLGVRLVHVLAGVTWFGLTGAILAVFWFVEATARSAPFRRIERLFPLAAVASLAGLFASGLYTAVYGAPTLPPGLLDLPGTLRVPFGGAYLALFLAKVAVLVPLALIAAGMGGTLRACRSPAAPGAPDKQAHLLRLAKASAALGLLLAADVTALIYLHNLSHLALVLPS